LLSSDGIEVKENDKLLALAQQISSEDITAAERRASDWRLARKAAPPQLHSDGLPAIDVGFLQ